MNSENEVAFSLSLLRKGIRSLTVMDDDVKESVISGTLGSIEELSVLDDILLEVHGTGGSIRLSLPRALLRHFRPSSPSIERTE
jgi:hypothetical protein